MRPQQTALMLEPGHLPHDVPKPFSAPPLPPWRFRLLASRLGRQLLLSQSLSHDNWMCVATLGVFAGSHGLQRPFSGVLLLSSRGGELLASLQLDAGNQEFRFSQMDDGHEAQPPAPKRSTAW